MEKERQPGICLAVIVIKENTVLIGRRKNIRGNGLYAFPGGHLKFREMYQDCAIREVKEECGDDFEVELIDKTFPFAAVPNEMIENGHYAVLFVRAKYIRGNPENMEKDKCEGWEWRPWTSLPQPIFSGIQYLIDNNRNPITEK